VHYWADLQSVHGFRNFRCYGSIAPNAKCQQVLVLTLCLVVCLRYVVVVEIILFVSFIRTVTVTVQLLVYKLFYCS